MTNKRNARNDCSRLKDSLPRCTLSSNASRRRCYYRSVERLRKRTFRNGRLSGQVVSELEQMISEEYPAPGQRLPKEADLAERFQVSRIVIREAMKILEDRGIVEVSAGRGTFTLTPSPDKVKEMLMRLFRDQPIPALSEMD